MNKLILTYLLCLLFWHLQAQPQSLSLQQCIKLATTNSTKVKKADIEVRKTEQIVKENLNSGYPQIHGTSQFNYNLALPAQLLPDFISPSVYGVLVKEGVKNGTGTGIVFPGGTPAVLPVRFGTNMSLSAGLEANQMVYNRVFALGVAATRKVVDFQKLFTEKSKEEVAYEVAKLYFQTQFLAKQKQSLRNNLTQLGSLTKLTELQLQNGLAKKIDLDRLLVSKSGIDNQLSNLDILQEKQLLLLKYLMEIPLDTEIQLTDTINENYSIPATAMLKGSATDKIDNKILDQNKVLIGLNIERKKAEYYPSLNAFGNLNFTGQGNTGKELFSNDRWFTSSALGLRANIPIYDGGVRKAQIQQYRLDIEKSEADRKFIQYTQDLQQRSALNDLLANQNNLKALQLNTNLAEDVFKVAQSRFKEGIASITELINAETALREAQNNYLSALLQLKISEIELLNLNGELKKLMN